MSSNNQQEHGQYNKHTEGGARNWQSVRTILDSLILLGIIWIVSSQMDSKVQSATIIAQIAAIQASISDVPAIREKITHMEAVQNELIRRQDNDDVIHQRMQDRKSP